jgi:hypothetical protein
VVGFDRFMPIFFRTDQVGNTVFYPWGIFGPGVIIEAEEKEKQVRGFVKYYCLAGLAGILGVEYQFGFTFALYAYLLWLLGYYLIIRTLLHDLPRAPKKLTYTDVFGDRTFGRGLAKLVILALISIVLAAVGLWIQLYEKIDDLSGWAWFGFFGFCAAALGWMIYRSVKNKS